MWVPCDYPSLCTAAPSKKIGQKAIFFWGEGTAVHTVHRLDYPRVVIRLYGLDELAISYSFFEGRSGLTFPAWLSLSRCVVWTGWLFSLYTQDVILGFKEKSPAMIRYINLEWKCRALPYMNFFSFLIHNRMGIRSNCPKYICCRFERSHRC